MTNAQLARRIGAVLLGIAITAVLHVVIQWAILAILLAQPREPTGGLIIPDIGPFLPILFIGVTQLVYMLTAIGVAWWRGTHDVMKGLIIGGILTFLWNAGFLAMLWLN